MTSSNQFGPAILYTTYQLDYLPDWAWLDVLFVLYYRQGLRLRVAAAVNLEISKTLFPPRIVTVMV